MKPSVDDRVAARVRPEGSPVMYQSWGDLLFMHWQVPEELLRKHIPARLDVDTFEGRAFVGVTPFTLWGVRPVFVPPVPFLSEFHEINVRTYVHLGGDPGVWFFSLDANSVAAVTGARAFYRLPYFNARIERERAGETTLYSASRTDPEGAPAEFEARWDVGAGQPEAEPGTLDFFLTERYCLYAADGDKLYRARIHHKPWPLHGARLRSYRSTMVDAAGLGHPAGEPLVHHGGPVDVEVWPLEEV
ncbi:MAG: DUF2071 domain-containing protein [Acidobacteria bacterium]|nr:DUF2071 domain-containing protein [Acidobacteriota bacterium]MCA1619756.1 DUF2071 domain-containing protein [Acidobacteriota bacterium]